MEAADWASLTVDQAEDRGVQPDAERESDYGEKSETGGLQQLLESKTKISHHFEVQQDWDAPSGAIRFN